LVASKNTPFPERMQPDFPFSCCVREEDREVRGTVRRKGYGGMDANCWAAARQAMSSGSFSLSDHARMSRSYGPERFDESNRSGWGRIIGKCHCEYGRKKWDRLDFPGKIVPLPPKCCNLQIAPARREMVLLCLPRFRSVVTGISSRYPKQGSNPSGQGHGQGAPKGHPYGSRHYRSAAEACGQRA
jgi:hypothetical protein